MNDTITITPEERALWASVATSRINAVTPERQCEITAQERLMKALKDLEQAEANVVRLTKERDWLADKCAMHCHDKDRDDILCSYDSCDISSLTCFGASGCDWIEAARRAVADSEVE